MTHVRIKLAVMAWAAACAAAPALAQQPASWQEITAAVDRVVSDQGIRESALCELRAAVLWGGYDVRVYLRGDATKDGKSRFLRVTKGVLSEEATNEWFGMKASSDRKGIVRMTTKGTMGMSSMASLLIRW